MSRILSTEEARTAIRDMQSIIGGSLTNEINNLGRQGQTLSDPNVWDGPLASQFRSSQWPETKRALDRAVQELGELRSQLDRINADIFAAGGGA